jgi:MFS family permease
MDHECLHHCLYHCPDGDGNVGGPVWTEARLRHWYSRVWRHIPALRFSESVPVLIVSRFLQGMGGGTMLICQVAVLSHQFQEGKERVKAFGVWGIIFGIGLGFGAIIGGMIVAVSNWQWVFLVHVLLSAITLILVFSGVQESCDPHAEKLDTAGIVTLSLSVFGLTYSLRKGLTLALPALPPSASLLLPR